MEHLFQDVDSVFEGVDKVHRMSSDSGNGSLFLCFVLGSSVNSAHELFFIRFHL